MEELRNLVVSLIINERKRKLSLFKGRGLCWSSDDMIVRLGNDSLSQMIIAQADALNISRKDLEGIVRKANQEN